MKRTYFWRVLAATDCAEAYQRKAASLPRSGMAAKRSYPLSEVRGGGRECQATMAQEHLRGSTPYLRSGVAARRSYPTSEVRGCRREEQPHIQVVVAVRVHKG